LNGHDSAGTVTAVHASRNKDIAGGLSGTALHGHIATSNACASAEADRAAYRCGRVTAMNVDTASSAVALSYRNIDRTSGAVGALAGLNIHIARTSGTGSAGRDADIAALVSGRYRAHRGLG
jgi:hypothetical protein